MAYAVIRKLALFSDPKKVADRIEWLRKMDAAEGRTEAEQRDHERRCDELERHETQMRANEMRQREAEAAAQMWGEW